jgi:hypothetical protein
MKPVTRPVASRAFRRHTRRRGPSQMQPTVAMTTGTSTAIATWASMVTSTHSATAPASTEALRSMTTSSTMLRSWTSSRKRLTASPGAPGNRPVAGPGSDTSERSRLTRGTVCQPTQQPCHWTATATSSDQRAASIPTRTASRPQGALAPDARESRMTLTAAPASSGTEKNITKPSRHVR